MRILHILDHSIPTHSGYSFRTKSIIEQQRKRGWETFQITGSKQGETAKLVESVDGLDFFRTPAVSSLRNLIPVLRQSAVIHSLAERLSEVIKQVKPDILHAHSPALNGMAALKMREQFGIPVLYEVRAFWEDAAVDHGTSRAGGLRYRLTRALETHVLKRADAITTICRGLRDDIIQRGIDEDKITVIPNGVNLDKFHGGGDVTPLVEKYNLQDSKVLGFIGSFYAYEGLSLLLQALPRIVLKVPEARLILVGEGNEYKSLIALSHKLEISDKVIFTGRVPHDQVNEYYQLMDVMVYPRLPMRLTDLVTPLKPMEAMALGRLVIASDVGGHKELIRNNETGILFKAADADALANAAIELLQHRERWPAQRVAARRYVEHERNWETVVARYEAVYEMLRNKEKNASAVAG